MYEKDIEISQLKADLENLKKNNEDLSKNKNLIDLIESDYKKL